MGTRRPSRRKVVMLIVLGTLLAGSDAVARRRSWSAPTEQGDPTQLRDDVLLATGGLDDDDMHAFWTSLPEVLQHALIDHDDPLLEFSPDSTDNGINLANANRQEPPDILYPLARSNISRCLDAGVAPDCLADVLLRMTRIYGAILGAV